MAAPAAQRLSLGVLFQPGADDLLDERLRERMIRCEVNRCSGHLMRLADLVLHGLGKRRAHREERQVVRLSSDSYQVTPYRHDHPTPVGAPLLPPRSRRLAALPQFFECFSFLARLSSQIAIDRFR